MRIAFFIDVFPRLSNTFILNQITGLLERGHEVDIFARSTGDFDHAHEDVARFCLRERMHHFVVPRNHMHRLQNAVRLLVKHRAWHPVMFQALDVRRHGRDAVSLVQLHTMLSFMVRRDYDIVHSQFGKLGPLLLPLRYAGILSAKLVTSFRGADLTRQLLKNPKIYEELFVQGDMFLPVSRTFASRLVEAGCNPDKVAVHHSGIIVDRFPFEERRLDPGEPARLLFVGRLTEKKGLRYALDALARVVSDGMNVNFTIVGDGEERGRIEQQIERLGLQSRVFLLGKKDQKEVVAQLQRSHLLIAPSLTAADGDQEGIPNVLKEAMATGIPVLATRHSGIPELVDDGVSGYLVEERNAEELAAGLRRLLEAADRWPSMGRAGRAKVEAEFDSGRLNDELVTLYRGLLEQPGKPAVSGRL